MFWFILRYLKLYFISILNKKLSFWFRVAQTIYKDQTTVGTGLDEINGNKKTEIKCQLQYQF